MTHAGMKELVPLKSLRKLYLSGLGVTDAGLKELALLKHLRELNLGGTKVTDAGLNITPFGFSAQAGKKRGIRHTWTLEP